MAIHKKTRAWPWVVAITFGAIGLVLFLLGYR